MAGALDVKTLGRSGVNVDKDPLELADDELRQSQNAIREPLGASAGITNRPGLIEFNLESAAATILGGIGVPIDNQSLSGDRTLYIGRGGF